MSLALFFAQHVSNASTFIFRSLRLCVGMLLRFDVCWRYGVVRLGWCGILMQAEASFSLHKDFSVNPLNVELNPICHFLALLGAHHIFHISRIRVNSTS